MRYRGVQRPRWTTKMRRETHASIMVYGSHRPSAGTGPAVRLRSNCEAADHVDQARQTGTVVRLLRHANRVPGQSERGGQEGEEGKQARLRSACVGSL